jgi:hypothetical protein
MSEPTKKKPPQSKKKEDSVIYVEFGIKNKEGKIKEEVL